MKKNGKKLVDDIFCLQLIYLTNAYIQVVRPWHVHLDMYTIFINFEVVSEITKYIAFNS